MTIFTNNNTQWRKLQSLKKIRCTGKLSYPSCTSRKLPFCFCYNPKDEGQNAKQCHGERYMHRVGKHHVCYQFLARAQRFCFSNSHQLEINNNNKNITSSYVKCCQLPKIIQNPIKIESKNKHQPLKGLNTSPKENFTLTIYQTIVILY